MNSEPLFYQRHIFVCTHSRTSEHSRPCCASLASDDLRIYMKKRCKELKVRRVRVNSSGCLNRCECGPVMVIYPEGVWYSFSCKEDIDEVIQSHLIGNRIVTHLQLSNNDIKPH
ncbi:MAG: (2Fe-2S) ferredoxin domain-containing protein [bacterium]|nr:(2Fe-2S) ferredoxin domain-containing protein [bacterium]